jgi:hypothetical protein
MEEEGVGEARSTDGEIINTYNIFVRKPDW